MFSLMHAYVVQSRNQVTFSNHATELHFGGSLATLSCGTSVYVLAMKVVCDGGCGEPLSVLSATNAAMRFEYMVNFC